MERLKQLKAFYFLKIEITGERFIRGITKISHNLGSKFPARTCTFEFQFKNSSLD